MTHTLNNGYIAVEVPEGSFGHQLYGGLKPDMIVCTIMPKPGSFKKHEIKIPPDNWSIVCLQSEIMASKQIKHSVILKRN